jgi:hypothetical protein
VFDPAMMGTLLIGLDVIDPDRSRPHRRRPAVSPRPARIGVRLVVAGALRRAADVLERRPLSEGLG